MNHFIREQTSPDYLPQINQCYSEQGLLHEAGYALSYHDTTTIGRLVHASKYAYAGPFPKLIVDQAVHVLRTYYPLQEIDVIVSVPPSMLDTLVEFFSRQVARQLHLHYLPALTRVYFPQEQKYLKNHAQKEDNIREAFAVLTPERIRERTLLLIDDIYDTGRILQEVSKALISAGANKVYPFAITRTMHSDDQSRNNDGT